MTNQTEKIKITRSLVNDVDRLSTDIKKIQEFIDALNEHKSDGIKKMYIVTAAGYQIEFAGHFSSRYAGRLFDLIIDSRTEILQSLNAALIELASNAKNIVPESNN